MSAQAWEVAISLTAISGNVKPSSRFLMLRPDQKKIPIGRASKTTSKGLVGDERNAWFESPVVSRDHARFELDDENNVIIRDTNSMHGTWVNDFKLARGSFKSVNTDDILTFGTEVQRGRETYSACSFRVKELSSVHLKYYEKAITSNSSTFSLPCPSDGEDDEASTRSEDEEEDEPYMEKEPGNWNLASSPESFSIDTPIKLVEKSNAVDLTTTCDTLASETNASEKVYSQEHVIEVIDSPESKESNENENSPIIIDTDNDSLYSASVKEYNISESHHMVGLDEEELSDSEVVEINRHAGIDWPISAGKYSLESRMSIQDSNEKEPFQDSEAREEALYKAMHIPELYSYDHRGNDYRRDDLYTSQPSNPVDKILADLLPTNPWKTFDAEHTLSSSFGRQSNIYSASQEIKGQDKHQCTAKVLGDKTGKHEFFSAREYNKSVVIPANAVEPLYAKEYEALVSPQEVPVVETTKDSKDIDMSNVDQAQPCTHIWGGLPVVDIAVPTTFPSRFYEYEHFSTDREPSPELDMTSAAKFNESKASVAARMPCYRQALSTVYKNAIDERSADVTSHDANNNSTSQNNPVLSTEPAEIPPAPKQLKRKSDDISTEEVGSKDTAFTRPAENVQTPPAKKFKRIIEAIGYAAVGGAAVGAGLFSLLVATAPDFL